MGGRGASIGGSAKVYSDEQIVSEKRKFSGRNSKGELVMSRFDADYKYKGFGSEQIQKNSNKYDELKGSHVSKDGNNAVVKIGESHVFKTQYGWGVAIDNTHTVFVKDWQVWGRDREFGAYVINFNRQYYNAKKWGNRDEFGSGLKLNKFDDVVKLAKLQERTYRKKKMPFTFENAEFNPFRR